MLNNLYLVIIVCIATQTGIEALRLLKIIQAVGWPYYKILMTIGDCKEKMIFTEQLLWRSVKLNRILDIYYKSGNENYKVSRVDITVVINDTDCYAVSNTGVGDIEFSATMYLPTYLGLMFYNLTIYSCSIDLSELNNVDVTQSLRTL